VREKRLKGRQNQRGRRRKLRRKVLRNDEMIV
jgi:hypothetical protein